ncbi:MAG: TraR/DksA C4-type zinc finger protein [Burkholderiales bacterium]
MLKPEQLTKLRAMIDQRHIALSAELHSDAARLRNETYGELAGAVPDRGDQATADVMADIDHADLSRDLRELRAVEAAQERIASGQYGSCMDCAGKIPFERLLAQPTALRCFDCQGRYEKSHVHPAEPKL